MNIGSFRLKTFSYQEFIIEGNSFGTRGWAQGKKPTLLILAIDVDRTSQKLKLEIHRQGRGGEHMSAVCLETSPPTPQNSYLKFQNPMMSLPGIYLKLAHFPVKIGLIEGVGGFPPIFFHCNPNIFVTQEPLQNFKTVAQTLLGETAHFGFCPPKIGFFRGVWGFPEIFFPLESSYFCDLGAHIKI